MYIPYNSSKEYHKYPFGAVESGTKVTFRIVLPRSFGCTGADFVFNKDGGAGKRASMLWDCMQGDNEEWWKIEIDFNEIGLFFYHFEYKTNWGVCKILKPNTNGFWQLTVYDSAFTTPEWLKGGIIYQIFPDRFFNSGKQKKGVSKDRILRSDHSAQPYWRPDEHGKILNNDYFSGDLKGIEQKIEYLNELGVSCIYLNPIFEAQSNHRYDTSDYEKIDPLLGDEKDFSALCKAAEKLGIKIILDGVFSHTGCDSRYFNKKGRYADLGAYQSKQSPYFSWYKFKNWPEDYQSWWGIDILPELNEDNPSFINYISGENGIAARWLEKGAGGWRLDVADELPDVFLDQFRKRVKKTDPEAVIIGEVWEDASNKASYGRRRRYLQGAQLDSVMNYPFANAIINFVRYGGAEGFELAVSSILENYPKPAIDTLMNHIGTHDTVRAITALAGESCAYRGRDWQAEKPLNWQERKKGIALLKQAAVLQFTLPGVPCIYYGDEAGLEGYKDPFNRGFYPWGHEETQLIDFYKSLGKIRRENNAFKQGKYETLSAVLGCVAYTRGEDILVIANSNNHPIKYYLPEQWHNCQLIFGQDFCDDTSVSLPEHGAVILKR